MKNKSTVRTDLKGLNEVELWTLLESVPASQVRLLEKIREALRTLTGEKVA